MTETSESVRAQAEELRKQSDAMFERASKLRQEELAAKPLLERLTFSAFARCKGCNLGLAYDPAGVVATELGGPLRKPNAWECSGLLLGTAAKDVEHDIFPFTFWELKSENQPSANGRTTRPTNG